MILRTIIVMIYRLLRLRVKRRLFFITFILFNIVMYEIMNETIKKYNLNNDTTFLYINLNTF